MSEPEISEAKRANLAVSAALQKLNEAIRDAAELGVEVRVETRAIHQGSGGARSTLVKAHMALVLGENQGEGDGTEWAEESEPTESGGEGTGC